MLSIKFWTFTKFSFRLDHWKEQKWQQTANNYAFLAQFQSDCVLGTSKWALDAFSKMTVSLKQAKRYSHLFKDDSVLETSAAALDAFSKMMVSLKQAQRHSTLFQR